ncbi:MAG: 3-hydroxyacyl-CoA dehydrogenase family protein [Candidatus Heimdallarchaeota archaeon]|nr:3-hydroxyacyl-CoA dehydrogenase family protein [Candidatus Heimdallarchaeota archaeon]
MEINKVGVIGTGAMGAGLIQVCALGGFEVMGQDIKQEFLDGCTKTIDRFLKLAVRREKTVTQEEADAAKQRITLTLNAEDLADCDIIIEAATEVMDLKKKIFANLDTICKPETILASNTSSLSILEMASVTKRTSRFVGLHFFNPVTHMKLVEIIKHEQLEEEIYEAAKDFVTRIDKEYITCGDKPGFVVNYILMQYLLGAVRAWEDGLASIADIDNGMKLGANHPMGPFELLDRIGLDVAVHVSESIHDKIPIDQFKTPQSMIDFVAKNKFGKKTGEGFYKYR